ncbi:MAG TPA: response regulator [Longimicrobiales bacterium]|nr:response regulator [Longimicrobiales bacterium]
MPPATATVLVVDDDARVRIALERLIGSAGYEVQTFGSATELLDAWHDPGPACVLLDVRLPDLDGLELHRRLQKLGVYLPVIFMTGYADIPTSVRAMKAGAFDFLTKPVETGVLMRTIRDALEEEARARSERVEVEELARRYSSLTRRETQIMQLVLDGMLNKEIARALGISEKTVKVHRSRVMSKMGARRVANLVHYAMLLGDAPDEEPGRGRDADSRQTAARAEPRAARGSDAYAADARHSTTDRDEHRGRDHSSSERAPPEDRRV